MGNSTLDGDAMRTTLDIDDAILEAAKALGRQTHRTAGAVLSDLARHATSVRKFRASSQNRSRLVRISDTSLFAPDAFRPSPGVIGECYDLCHGCRTRILTTDDRQTDYRRTCMGELWEPFMASAVGVPRPIFLTQG
jgi:hypothetical protein